MSGHTRNAPESARSACAQELEMRIARIVWQSPDDDGPVIVRGTRDESAKIEHGSQHVSVGDLVRLLGQYEETPRWGRQFSASTWLPSINGDRAGAVKYLVDLCPGIGQTIAKRLVARFGHGAVRILREEPELCVADQLLTTGVAERASAALVQRAWTERVTIAVTGLLAGRGFGGRAVRGAIRAWGDRADEVISTNPWRLLLAKIPGAGWKRVDQLYLERGGDPAALKRQAMAGWYEIREASTGSTWHPLGLFSRGILMHLGLNSCRFHEALKLAVRGKLVECSPESICPGLIADPTAAGNERAVAYYLARLIKAGPAAWPMLTTPAVSEHQASQVNGQDTSRVMLLTGTPGTGKTFVAAALLRLIARSHGTASIAVAAPTGKAAVRITAALAANDVPIKASTIHSLLQIRKAGYDGNGWTFEHGPKNPLPYSWIAIDEVSMLDTDLASALFGSIRPGTHVLLVGDPYQLPPVGHGATLRDIQSAIHARAELTEVQRNSGLITAGCIAIKDGRMPEFCDKFDASKGDNLKLIVCRSAFEQRERVNDLVRALREKPGVRPLDDIAILTPRNDAELIGRRALNDYLRDVLNPPQAGDAKTKQTTWRMREKIICLKNGWHMRQVFDPRFDLRMCMAWEASGDGSCRDDYCYVANGELGRVVAVDQEKADCILRFEDPTRHVRVQAKSRVQHDDGSDSASEDGWGLGYALSNHKSQGSEWPYVIQILDPGADRVASRELIYTGISRGKVWTALLGTEETLRRQLARAELPARKTLLKELIIKELADE